jgi:hypothetical protein
MPSREIHTLVKQIGGAVTLDVCHEDCTLLHRGLPSVTVFVEDPTQPCDTLTQIALVKENERKEVHLYWRAEDLRSCSLLLIEETSRLFIGTGRSVAVFDYQNGVFVNEYLLFCFYGFGLRGRYVLVTSELECLLLSRAGEILGRVTVDPPWEEHPLDEGIAFDSPVSGRQVLRWPASPAD